MILKSIWTVNDNTGSAESGSVNNHKLPDRILRLLRCWTNILLWSPGWTGHWAHAVDFCWNSHWGLWKPGCSSWLSKSRRRTQQFLFRAWPEVGRYQSLFHFCIGINQNAREANGSDHSQQRRASWVIIFGFTAGSVGLYRRFHIVLAPGSVWTLRLIW